ncbi:hypothetical protein ABZ855_33310, partial [Streptomyces sp. NPDC047042]
ITSALPGTDERPAGTFRERITPRREHSVSADMLDQAVNAGLWFSVNPAMIASAQAQRLPQEIPPDRVLLETHSPLTRHNSKPSRPPDLLPRLAAS